MDINKYIEEQKVLINYPTISIDKVELIKQKCIEKEYTIGGSCLYNILGYTNKFPKDIDLMVEEYPKNNIVNAIDINKNFNLYLDFITNLHLFNPNEFVTTDNLHHIKVETSLHIAFCKLLPIVGFKGETVRRKSGEFELYMLELANNMKNNNNINTLFPLFKYRFPPDLDKSLEHRDYIGVALNLIHNKI